MAVHATAARRTLVALVAGLAATAGPPAAAVAPAPPPAAIVVTATGATIDTTFAVRATTTSARPRRVRVELGRTRFTLRHRTTRRDLRHRRILSTWRVVVPRRARPAARRLVGRRVTLVLTWRGGRTTRLRRTATARPSAATVPLATRPTTVPLPAPAPTPGAPADPAPAPDPVVTSPRDLPITTAGATLGHVTITGVLEGGRAVARTAAPAIALPPGTFRLTSCLRVVVPGTAGARLCRRRTVDLAQGTAVAAPAVDADVPLTGADGRQGFAQGVVTVEVPGPDTWRPHASSPTAGIDVSAVPLAAPGAAVDPLPHLLAAPFTARPGTLGGVDTGAPESFCAGYDAGPADAPPAGVTPTAPGADAPAYHEVGEPAGAFAGRPPLGVVVLFHGGGWYAHGEQAAAWARPEAERWRARGWRTVAATHRPCADAVTDALWVADRVLAAAGDLPVCTSGMSAGGHLALLVAAARPAVDCAIGYGAPTDLVAIGGERVDRGEDPAVGDPDGPRWVANLAVAAFGERALPGLSPARLPIAARVLVATAREDWAIPWQQATALRDAQQARDPAAYVDLARLDAGPLPWVHGSVTAASRQDVWRREEALVAPLVAP